MTSQTTAPGPLAGIRVLDLATMLAGPYGATLLGDLGADVIKVESPEGDDCRRLGAEREGERGPFIGLNRNKRDLVLDLEKPAAREVFARLVRTADVLVTNVRGLPIGLGRTPGTVRSLGPELGQHTEEILTGTLGYSWEQVGEMKEQGVIL